ncbi:haloacid dehalogenase-like hydrolase [Nocardiopsis exhalans]|uniref:Phosphoglycolate phosphatase-like HAD superfamily hydrolase n=4 Tax=Nocardiopsidaceae TaxID=83676 RepID=A0A840WB70_9ACTN|nr:MULTISPECIES: haloacid dehalogenase-like hydrolase [Nocardiopsaceae]MBB5493404.1 phosphoglycolate phosphatase-like HAD superfamily hydrolase [Nocardiopsis metallicus]MCK9873021.1 haloacid dehalogenase-like hydrolase [Nocardiopsis dassonvillei]MEE2051617.1 haloacid dehalogenase-like hydrolase [Nocardiopsis umidischolae]PSK87520.1 phosphoglycolate phosphatase-like HAD superfamily hydrolase [Murinocardiopsis flavida]USY19855.1 haloacid dehalogenase-like hydrolase [Nocardiopsis exhalans]
MPDTLLVLWDVDHTLIETRGVGGEVFAEAFEAATGRPLSAGMAKAAGHTEPVLLRKTLHLNGITDPGPEVFERFLREQADGYRRRQDRLRTQGRALPGVTEALQTLSRRQHIVQSVLTGNTRAAAEIKLAAFGLDRWLDFDLGAYGDDDDNRPALVEVAHRRTAEKLGKPISISQIVLIGDTPKDVEAALTSGARVLGVASGASSVEELRRAGADRVLASLADTDIVELLSELVEK